MADDYTLLRSNQIVQILAKVDSPGCEDAACRQVEADVVSKSSNNIHQTWRGGLR